MEYKDRSTGLIVFGILTVGLGGLCALLILLIFAAQMIPTPASSPKMPITTLIPGMAMYAVLAVALVWLGIGSAMATRWSRALMLIFSWSWLVAGVMGMTVAAIMVPMMIENLSSLTPANPDMPAPPQAAMAVGLIIGLGFDGFILIVLPAVWTFFYNSRHVKATCEAHHPQSSWTDACPLPVLGVVCWLVFTVPMVLVGTLCGTGVLPFFGVFLAGVSGRIAFVVLGALYLVSAWLLYRLDVRGWWIIVGIMVFFLVSTILTFMQRDILDMYRAMNFPPAQLDQLAKMDFFKNKPLLLGLAGVFAVPIFGYLLYIRRYFQRPNAV